MKDKGKIITAKKNSEHNARSDILILASCIGCLQDIIKDEMYGYEISGHSKKRVLKETEEMTMEILKGLDKVEERKDMVDMDLLFMILGLKDWDDIKDCTNCSNREECEKLGFIKKDSTAEKALTENKQENGAKTEDRDYLGLDFTSGIKIPGEVKDGKITVSCDYFANMVADMYLMIYLHERLISYYEKESKLKKQHKAYVHVRDKAEKICAEDKAVIKKLVEKY